MNLVRLKVNNGNLVKNGVYIFDPVNTAKIPAKYADIIPFNDLKPYTNEPNLLLVRSGGIGDLMAYSILHDRAPQVVFVTQDKYRQYMKLWQTPPRFKAFHTPIFMAASLTDFQNKLKQYGRLTGREDDIERGSKDNWYQIISESAGIPVTRLRPQLIKPTGQTIQGCMIVSKASITDRTANHEDIIKAASPYFNHIILSHNQEWSNDEYIAALMRYEYVISVDTSAIHIREGLGLPALGLYGAFVKECRTSGYQYTTSIQVDSGCPPCQRHSRIPCNKNLGTPFAPCLSGQTMINQIQNEIHNYLTTTRSTAIEQSTE
jgi:hypothetical protein